MFHFVVRDSIVSIVNVDYVPVVCGYSILFALFFFFISSFLFVEDNNKKSRERIVLSSFNRREKSR